MTKIFGLFLILFSSLAYAKDVLIDAKGSSYFINIPDNYTFYKKFLALENLVMSPSDKKFGTSSLSFMFMNLKDSKFDSNELQKSQKLYQEGRNIYIEERKLTLVDFLPYKLEKSPQGHPIHTIGVVYTNGDKVTLDKGYMIETPQSFIHAKFVGDIAIHDDIPGLKKLKKYKSPHFEILEKSVLTLRRKE